MRITVSNIRLISFCGYIGRRCCCRVRIQASIPFRVAVTDSADVSVVVKVTFTVRATRSYAQNPDSMSSLSSAARDELETSLC